MTSSALLARPTGTRPAWLVTVLCWLIVVFDGYDLIVYGTTIPPLLEEPGWNLTASSAGFIGLDANLGVGSNFLTFSLAAAEAAVLLLVTAVTTKPVTRAPVSVLAH